MVTGSATARRAFTCGFGPGHHAHPRETFVLAQLPPTPVRAAALSNGMLVVVDADGARSEWWHHDQLAVRDAIDHSDGFAFLHGDAVLRVGNRLFSVTRTPTPCDDGTAHLDPDHPAWAGPPVEAPVLPSEAELRAARDKHNRHYEPGHHLPFWRLEAALEKGPGVIVDLVDPRSGGEVVLELGRTRLRRYHHNPRRITAALEEATGGTPYRYPAGSYTIAPHPDLTPTATRFGDAPVASLLDDEVLRVGDAYFWLGRATDRAPKTCGYLDGPGSQYFRQRNMAMFVGGFQYLPAPLEHVFITELARKEADRFEPWADERDGVTRPEQPVDPPSGFLVPAGDVSTDEGRSELASAIAQAARSMFVGRRFSTYAGHALYGEPIIQ